MRKTWLVVLIETILLFGSCTNEDQVLNLIDSGLLNNQATLKHYQQLQISPVLSNNEGANYQWKLNGEVVSDQPKFLFSGEKMGLNILEFTAKRLNEKLEINYNLDVLTADVSPYIDTVFAYIPAPGQFINTSIGNPEAAQTIIGGKTGMVTLGSFGGYIIAGFDHTVKNSSGNDIIIYANAYDGSSEPGIVKVSIDANRNGIPDDEWFELAGESHSNENTIRNYSVTYSRPVDNGDIAWIDNQGKSGNIPTNSFHTQSYFPSFICTETQITFTGTLLPSNQIKNEYGIWKWIALGKGYADNYSSEYNELLGNQFDISNAIDKNGQPAILDSINFISVYTAVMSSNSVTGDQSTEIRGIADLHHLQ